MDAGDATDEGAVGNWGKEAPRGIVGKCLAKLISQGGWISSCSYRENERGNITRGKIC